MLTQNPGDTMTTRTTEEVELSDPSTCPEPTRPRTGDPSGEKMVLSDNEQDDALDALTYIQAPTRDPLEIHGWDYSTTMENLATDQCSMWMNKEGAKVLAYRAYRGRLDNIEDLAKLRNNIKSALGTNTSPVVAVSVPKNGKSRKDTPPFCTLIKGITQEQAQELVTRVRATTGGEGLWKRVFTCWEHFRLWQKVLPMFLPDTFHSHFKCNLNICIQCDQQ